MRTVRELGRIYLGNGTENSKVAQFNIKYLDMTQSLFTIKKEKRT